jgi:hypothetical protein
MIGKLPPPRMIITIDCSSFSSISIIVDEITLVI